MLESDKIWEKIRPNMMAEDDLLLVIFVKYTEREFQKKVHKTQIEGQKTLLHPLEIGGKSLLVTPKNYLPELLE